MPAASGHRPGGAPAALPAARRVPAPAPDSPLSTSLPFLAVAAFPMPGARGRRGQGGEWGLGPPRRSTGRGDSHFCTGQSGERSRRGCPEHRREVGAGSERGDPENSSSRATAAGAAAAAGLPRADTPPSPPRPPCAPPGSRAPRRSRPLSFPRTGARPGCDAPARDAAARPRGVSPAEVHPGGRDWLAGGPPRPDIVFRAGVPTSRASPAPWSGAWKPRRGWGCLCPASPRPLTPRPSSTRSPCRREPHRRVGDACEGTSLVLASGSVGLIGFGHGNNLVPNPDCGLAPLASQMQVFAEPTWSSEFLGTGTSPLVFPVKFSLPGYADRCHTSLAETKENITVSAECLLMCGAACSSFLCRYQNKCISKCKLCFY